MLQRKASATVPYSSRQMYDLAVDMDRYPEFLPWCAKARKYDVTETSFRSEMTFALKGLRETFHTIDHIEPGRRITISNESGPFRHLESEWLFTDVPGGSRIDFHIEFRFKNRLLDLTLGPLFGEATRKMVSAFEQRARAIYSNQPQ